MYLHVFVCVCVCWCVCVCLCVYAHVCVYVPACVYIYICICSECSIAVSLLPLVHVSLLLWGEALSKLWVNLSLVPELLLYFSLSVMWRHREAPCFIRDGVAMGRTRKGIWRTACIPVKLQANWVFMSRRRALCFGEPICHALILRKQQQRVHIYGVPGLQACSPVALSVERGLRPGMLWVWVWVWWCRASLGKGWTTCVSGFLLLKWRSLTDGVLVKVSSEL